jgi:hypothetical protein
MALKRQLPSPLTTIGVESDHCWPSNPCMLPVMLLASLSSLCILLSMALLIWTSRSWTPHSSPVGQDPDMISLLCDPVNCSVLRINNRFQHMFRLNRVWFSLARLNKRSNCSLQYGVTDIREVDGFMWF